MYNVARVVPGIVKLQGSAVVEPDVASRPKFAASDSLHPASASSCNAGLVLMKVVLVAL